MEKNPEYKTGENQDPFLSIVPKVVPQGLVTLDWLNEPCPIFMSPPLFSRMDVPVVSVNTNNILHIKVKISAFLQEYNFRNESGMAAASNKNVNVIGRLRKRRSLQAIFLNFEDEYVPEKPRELAIRNLTIRFIKQDDVDAVRKVVHYFYDPISRLMFSFSILRKGQFGPKQPWLIVLVKLNRRH